MNRYLTVSHLLLWLVVPQLFAQEGNWKTFDVANSGLASNDVRAIAVDGDFIWFGTFGGGLSQYTNSTGNWNTFNTGNSPILDNDIQSVAASGENVWIGTNFGASIFRKSTGTWTNLNAIGCVSGIAIDGNEVWVSTAENGVSRFDQNANELATLNTSNSSLLSNTVTAVVIDGSFVWFATNSGVSRLARSTGTWLHYTVSNSELANNNIAALAIDGDNVWQGHAPSSAGAPAPNTFSTTGDASTACLQKWLLSKVTSKPPGSFLPSASWLDRITNDWRHFQFCKIDSTRNEQTCYPVYALAAGAQDIWLAAASSGIHRFDKNSGVWTNFNGTNSGLAGDWAWTIAIDGPSVWIGTFGGGVSRYRTPEELWQCYRANDGLVDESVESISVYGDEAWFGTHRGLARLQISSGNWTSFTPQNSDIGTFAAWYVAADSQFVWVGPNLQRYDKFADTWTVIDTTESLLGSSLVFDILATRDYVWFGADGGKVSQFNRGSNNWQLFPSKKTGLTGRIYAIDNVGEEAWFGSFGSGVSWFDLSTGVWTHFTTSNSGLANDNVTGVAIDGDFVWVTTFGNGISHYQKSTDSWTTFDDKNTGMGPFINVLWAVVVDGDFVWFGSHSRGVFRYQKSTATWENFNHLNTQMAARRVHALEADGRFVWISVFDTPDLSRPSVRVGSVCRFGDVSPPELVHSPIFGEKPSVQSVLIIATIDDNTEVKSAHINYRGNNNEAFKSAPMQRVSGEAWVGQIPAFDVHPGTMEYYLSTTDGRNISTHPFSSATNNPHRFNVFDSVLPSASASISSPTGFLSGDTVLAANVVVNGTGSTPAIISIDWVGFSDFSGVSAIDTFDVVFSDSSTFRDVELLTLNGKITLDLLNRNFAGLKLMVCVTDEGHDESGKPNDICVLSNPLFKSFGGANISAEQGGTVWDNTGRAQLYLPPNALRSDELVSLIIPEESIPDSIGVIGDVFEIRPTGLELRKHSVLTITLTPEQMANFSGNDFPGIYELQKVGFDSNFQTTRIGGSVNKEKRSISTAITHFGTYAIITADKNRVVQTGFLAKLQCLPRAINPKSESNRAETAITFTLAAPGAVSIRIYNLAGRLKRTLIEKEAAQKGVHVKVWDGRDQKHHIVPTGLYVICVDAGGVRLTQPVMVMGH